MNADNLDNQQADYPDVPTERWWIVEFALRNRGPIVGASQRSNYDLSEDQLIDLLDQCAPKVALPHDPQAWKTGFPDERYENPEAGLMVWLVKAVNNAAMHERRDRGRIADLTPEAFDRLMGENAIDERVDLVAAQQEYAQLSDNAKTVARFRSQGLSRAAQVARGFSVRQMNNGRAELQAAGRRLASFGPIPLIAGFFKRNGAESASAVGGGGATVAVAGTAGSKVVAGCVASLVCVGTVGGVVAVKSGDDAPSKPKTARKSSAPKPAQRLYTPITPSKTAKTQSAKADATSKRARRKSRDSNDSSAKATEREFGIETPTTSQPPASNPSSSGGSSSGSNSSSGNKPEFGVEAGQ